MNNKIGIKIRTLRKNLNIYQKDMCCDILNRTVLSKIENGKITPSILQLQHISNKLNVPINYFLEEKSDSIDTIEYVNGPLNVLFDQNKFYEIIKFYEKNKVNSTQNFENYFYIGHAYYNTDFYYESLKILRKYTSSCMQQPDNILEKSVLDLAFAFNTLSKIMLKNENYKKAISYLFMAKKYLEKYEKFSNEIYFKIINNIGSVYILMNEYSKIINVLQPFLDNISNLGYLRILPSMHLSLNIAYYNLDEYEKSIGHIKKAIFFYNYTGRYQLEYGCYLNYINALRYCKLYDEAFDVLKQYKLKYPNEREQDFLIQEAVLLFNTQRYKSLIDLSHKIKLRKLSKLNIMGYYFMIGHIYFLQENYINSKNLLLKCENYFLRKNFCRDLKCLYNDLYEITKDETYKEKSAYFNKLKGKKNILVE